MANVNTDWIEIMAAATRMASSRNQTIGARHEYYVTIAQLEAIISRRSELSASPSQTPTVTPKETEDFEHQLGNSEASGL